MWALAGVLPLLWAGRSVAPGQEARFEAVSIKANRSGEAQTRYEAPTGRLNAINVPLRFFIRRAFDLPDARIVGGPAWLETDRFDIVATLPPDADSDVMRRMMQTLLTDRFTLTARREVRELPVYSLVRLRRSVSGSRPPRAVPVNARRSTRHARCAKSPLLRPDNSARPAASGSPVPVPSATACSSVTSTV
jgi:uncharacterized protein (TIGR03435 family)